MALTKALDCFHGQVLSFENTQSAQLAEERTLRDLTSSGSLKKNSFLKRKLVLYFTKILLNLVRIASNQILNNNWCNRLLIGLVQLLVN